MKLWILRHGEAEPRTTTDEARALTKHGRKEAEGAGHSLAKHAGAALVALASPYRRAQETAAVALGEFKHTPTLLTVDWCTPEDDPREALKHLVTRPEAELLLVSHMPFVSALAGLLIHADPSAGPSMHTGSLLELDLPTVGAGTAHLLSVRHPPEFKKAHS